MDQSMVLIIVTIVLVVIASICFPRRKLFAERSSLQERPKRDLFALSLLGDIVELMNLNLRIWSQR